MWYVAPENISLSPSHLSILLAYGMKKEVPYTKLTSLIDVLGADRNTPPVLTEIIWNVLCFSC